MYSEDTQHAVINLTNDEATAVINKVQDGINETSVARIMKNNNTQLLLSGTQQGVAQVEVMINGYLDKSRLIINKTLAYNQSTGDMFKDWITDMERDLIETFKSWLPDLFKSITDANISEDDLLNHSSNISRYFAVWLRSFQLSTETHWKNLSSQQQRNRNEVFDLWTSKSMEHFTQQIEQRFKEDTNQHYEAINNYIDRQNREFQEWINDEETNIEQIFHISLHKHWKEQFSLCRKPGGRIIGYHQVTSLPRLFSACF